MPLAKFTYNNSVHTSTQETPFYINYGYYPKIDMLPTWRGENPVAENSTLRLKELYEMMKIHFEEAQTCYKEFVDVKRIKERSN